MNINFPALGVSGASGMRTLETPRPAESDFSGSLEKAMEKVEAVHAGAAKQVGELIAGGGTDVHAALIAVEKANLSFQLMMQMRNKIVEAYQEISRMPF